MIIAVIVIFTLSLCIYFYLSIREKQKYFEKLGIPHKKPVFFFGHAWTTLFGKESMSAFLTRMYTEHPGEGLIGIYHGTAPVILVRDPELASVVLTKEFSHFHDRGMVIDEEVNPLEGHLFNLAGPKWRALRRKLSPTFTSARIKNMYPLMEACIDRFVEEMEMHVDQEMDLKVEFLKLAAHVIESCTFGIETDSIKNENSDFIRLGLKIIQPDLKEMILTILRFFSPWLGRKLNFKTIPGEVNDFFLGMVTQTLDKRQETGYKRNDFLQLLLELRERGELSVEKDEDLTQQNLGLDSNETVALTDNVLAAQAAVFLAAGFETTSTSLALTCYQLSKDSQVQEELRKEIKRIKNKHGGLTYSALKEMPYLDAVLNESLRLWPPVGGLLRVCTKSTHLGGYKVEKGVIVHVPSEAYQRDPINFPQPHDFKPERFLETTPDYTFLPFGAGPRVCIGERFARLELKLAVAKLVEAYRIDTCHKMASLEPIKFKIGSFINVPKDGVFCILRKISA